VWFSTLPLVALPFVFLVAATRLLVMLKDYRHNCDITAFAVAMIAFVSAIPGCETALPSTRASYGIDLPRPKGIQNAASEEDREPPTLPPNFRLTPRTLIPVTFNFQPGVKSSFQRFKSEEARYDFFVASRDSLTPRLRTTNDFGENRYVIDRSETISDELVDRNRSHVIEFGVEKRFFDTTELDLAVGYDTEDFNDDIGNQPFASATLRYPLWVSRQKLERTSEDIFRQNELNDTQLDYIQTVRNRIQGALFSFHNVVQLRTTLADTQSRYDDLVAVQTRLREGGRANRAADLSRLDAEIARLAADIRNQTGRFTIDVERLKEQCGIPFSAKIEIVDEPFNPFEGMTHEELMKAALDTDPEIATQRNAVRNAEVQLDLAKRGTWDLTLLLGGRSSMEGQGNLDGSSDWSVSMGLDVSAVDSRVTDSLIRQADANIARFNQAISQREREIYVDTLEPYIRLETISESRIELMNSLPQFEEDYSKGVEEYFAGSLNIDDLITRRENLFNQQREVSSMTFLIGANVSELLSATGMSFELLEFQNGSPDGLPAEP